MLFSSFWRLFSCENGGIWRYHDLCNLSDLMISVIPLPQAVTIRSVLLSMCNVHELFKYNTVKGEDKLRIVFLSLLREPKMILRKIVHAIGLCYRKFEVSVLCWRQDPARVRPMSDCIEGKFACWSRGNEVSIWRYYFSPSLKHARAKHPLWIHI